MSSLDQLIGLFRFRENPLELLTLSACQTGVGDDRAALGLAGVAIKAGARSALATLWFINDEASAELVSEFYRQLRNPKLSKAQALQLAQQKLLSDRVYEHLSSLLVAFSVAEQLAVIGLIGSETGKTCATRGPKAEGFRVEIDSCLAK